MHPNSTPTAAPTLAPAMTLALQASFDSVAHWRESFAALCGAAAEPAPSLVRLAFVPHQGRLVNQRTNGPAETEGAAVPLLTFDLTGPASRGAADPVDAFFQAIDWATVYERYRHAVDAASEAFGAAPDDLPGAALIDVRRAGVYEQADALIPGATWRDPAAVDAWVTALPAGEPVVVYCVYGHEVGRATALRLRAAGVAARFLRGGIHGWRNAGRPVQAKADTHC